MAAISETLRQARLRSGVDLDRLAAKTKINPRYLAAIEAGDFDKLPSGIFARMFIKQYADAVGLDGASFAEEYQRSSQFGSSYSPVETRTVADSRPTSFEPSVPFLSSAGGSGDRLTSMLSSLIWVVAAILVCAGAYYALAHLPSRTVTARKVETPPPAVITPAPVVTPAAQPEVPAKTAEPSVSPDTPPPPAAPDSSIELSLTATEPVWVTVTADGNKVIAETIPAGATRKVSAAKSARVRMGNAANVDITFNGKKLEPFGTRGQVRTVDFTSWGAQVVSRTLPSANDEPSNPDPLR